MGFLDFKGGKLTENSLYQNATDKASLIQDKTKLMDAFYINFLGFIGLYSMGRQAPFKQYEQTEGKLFIDNITDTNHDFSLAIKLLYDEKIIPRAVVDKMTKLLVKIKGNQIKPKEIDPNIIRDIIKEMHYNSNRGSTIVMSVVGDFVSGKMDLHHMAYQFYQISKKPSHKNISTEFRNIGVKYTALFQKMDSANAPQNAAIPTQQAAAAPITTAPTATIPTADKNKQQANTKVNDIPPAPVSPVINWKDNVEFWKELFLARGKIEIKKVLKSYNADDVEVRPLFKEKLSEIADDIKYFANFDKSYSKIMTVNPSRFLSSFGFIIKRVSERIFKKEVNDFDSLIEFNKKLNDPENGDFRYYFFNFAFSDVFILDSVYQILTSRINKIQTEKDIIDFRALLKANNIETTNPLIKAIDRQTGFSDKVLQYKVSQFINTYQTKYIYGIVESLFGVDVSSSFNPWGPTFIGKDLWEGAKVGKSELFNGLTKLGFFKKFTFVVNDADSISDELAAVKDAGGLAKFHEKYLYSSNTTSKIPGEIIEKIKKEFQNKVKILFMDESFIKSINNNQARGLFWIIRDTFNDEAYGAIALKYLNYVLSSRKFDIKEDGNLFGDSIFQSLDHIHFPKDDPILKNIGSKLTDIICDDIEAVKDLEPYSGFGTLNKKLYEGFDEFALERVINVCLDSRNPEISNLIINKFESLISRVGFVGYFGVKSKQKLRKETVKRLFDSAILTVKPISKTVTSDVLSSIEKRIINSDEVNGWISEFFGQLPDSLKTPDFVQAFYSGLPSIKLDYELYKKIPAEKLIMGASSSFPGNEDIIKAFNEKLFSDQVSGTDVILLLTRLSNYSNDAFFDTITRMDLDNPKNKEKLINGILEQTRPSGSENTFFRTISDQRIFLKSIKILSLLGEKCFEVENPDPIINRISEFFSNKSKIPKEHRESVLLDLSGLFINGSITPNMEKAFSALDSASKKVVGKTFADAEFGLTALGEINEEGPIRPRKKLERDSLIRVLKLNGVDPGGSLLDFRKIKSDASLQTIRDAVQSAKKFGVEKQAVAEVIKTEEELERMSVMYNVYNKYKHGNIAIKILKVFDVNLAKQDAEWKQFEEKYSGSKFYKKYPQFHGTSSIATSMILRYGFSVFDRNAAEKAGIKYAGKMLGDGIYSSNVLDKVGQYVNDDAASGISRARGVIGYILEIETQGVNWGSKIDSTHDFSTAGTGEFRGEGSVISPEWAWKNGNAQCKIKRCFEVELIDKREMEKLTEKHKNVLESAMNFKSFGEYLAEARRSNYIGDKSYASFTFMDNVVPIGNRKYAFLDDGDTVKLPPGARMYHGAFGVTIQFEYHEDLDARLLFGCDIENDYKTRKLYNKLMGIK